MANNITKKIDNKKIESSIRLLNTYLEQENIAQLITVLEDLKQNPQDETILPKIKQELDKLGIIQGAVFTYAPYINVILSDDPFGE